MEAEMSRLVFLRLALAVEECDVEAEVHVSLSALSQAERLDVLKMTDAQFR
jgi:hypothetical protein